MTPNCADNVASFSPLLLLSDFLNSVLIRWPFKARFYAAAPIIRAGEGCFSPLIANKGTKPYLKRHTGPYFHIHNTELLMGLTNVWGE